MLLQALIATLLGLALAWAAVRRLPHRLPAPVLVLPTGVAGALFGAFVTHTALDAGGLVPVLIGAVTFAVASLSLLLRPAGALRHRSATA
ncbi:hypothetical protein VM636_10330 [Streptomyces sp. SCSIO 75703]|uniref:hypothetical protein n=1 Tax=unclassified Streptomyces TaxID=2593676 RepID=UPI0004C1D0FA|nr:MULTISPECIES: hypothetical protein [unclassified Streptomyces]